TLVRNRLLTRYKQFSLRWNGRLGAPSGFSFARTTSGRTVLLPTNHGRLAPAGEYRVRVSLRARRRAVLSPRTFTLVRRWAPRRSRTCSRASARRSHGRAATTAPATRRTRRRARAAQPAA